MASHRTPASTRSRREVSSAMLSFSLYVGMTIARSTMRGVLVFAWCTFRPVAHATRVSLSLPGAPGGPEMGRRPWPDAAREQPHKLLEAEYTGPSQRHAARGRTSR